MIDMFTLKRRLQKISLFAMLLALTACGTPHSVSINPNTAKITGSFNVGKFTVKRVEVDIDGFSSKTISLNKNKNIEPKAVIWFQGVGVLQAHWLIDGQIKERINMTLNHGSLLTLKPTFILPSQFGQHVIQFNILQPTVNFKIPKVTVFVTH